MPRKLTVFQDGADFYLSNGKVVSYPHKVTMNNGKAEAARKWFVSEMARDGVAFDWE